MFFRIAITIQDYYFSRCWWCCSFCCFYLEIISELYILLVVQII